MKKIIYIADPEILSVPIRECGEPLIDLKNQTEILFGPTPECDLTKNDYTKIRKSVFQKLCVAQKKLPHGFRFKLYEGFRSLIVQKILFDDIYQRVSARLPNTSHETRFHETTRLASPVINFDGTPNIPAHNTGGAIDIEIIDQHGEFIDMGMTAKDWAVVDPGLCLTNCNTISEKAKNNRQLLLKIMQEHGFINYPNEWWHFSYGDRYWAYFKSEKQAIYGSADHVTVLCNGEWYEKN